MNYVQKDHVTLSVTFFLILKLTYLYFLCTYFTLKITCFIYYKFEKLRAHEYLSRDLINNNFQFNWKKTQWYNITICTNLPINTISFLVNTCAYVTN